MERNESSSFFRVKEDGIFLEDGLPGRLYQRLDGVDDSLLLYEGRPSTSLFPGARMCHTASLIGDSLIIFGGLDGKKRCLRDIHIFSTSEQRWYLPQVVGQKPSPRFGHCAVVASENTILIHGGSNGIDLFGEFYTLRVSKAAENGAANSSGQVTSKGNVLTCKWQLTCKPTILLLSELSDADKATTQQNSQSKQVSKFDGSRRYGHAMCKLHNSLYLFGGNGCHNDNNIYRFDIDDFSYEIIDAKGTRPAARYYHFMDVIHDKIYVIGGRNWQPLSDIFFFDTNSLVWTEVKVLMGDGSSLQPEMYSPRGVVMGENIVFLYGGLNTEEAALSVYNVRLQEWQRGDLKVGMGEEDTSTLREGLCRICHTVTKGMDGRMLYVYGGESETSILSGLDAVMFSDGFLREMGVFGSVVGEGAVMMYDEKNGWKKGRSSDGGSTRVDMSGYFNNNALSDVTFVIGNRVIHAHKVVLAATNPYFKKLFESEPNNTIKTTISVLDWSFESIFSMLNFLYTSWRPRTRNIAQLCEILELASVYQVKGLLSHCAESLVQLLTVDNSCKILRVAHHLSCDTLKKECIKFIGEATQGGVGTLSLAELTEQPSLAFEVLLAVLSPLASGVTEN